MTAELALLLPVVLLVLLALLATANAGITQVRVSDAGPAAARAAAIGEPQSVIHATAHQLAGGDAEVEVSRDGALVVVTVRQDLPGVLALADLRAAATARAMPEPE